MVRSFALAAFAIAIFCALPVAHAQDDLPELDGGPPPLKIPKPAPAKPTPPETAAKPARPSADLLRAEEERLNRQAELPATPEAPQAGSRLSRISYQSARRVCMRAGMDEALGRDLYSARYHSAPRLFERELRGVMRLDDGRGYLLVDTICELDDDGRAVDFVILR